MLKLNQTQAYTHDYSFDASLSLSWSRTDIFKTDVEKPLEQIIAMCFFYAFVVCIHFTKQVHWAERIIKIEMNKTVTFLHLSFRQFFENTFAYRTERTKWDKLKTVGAISRNLTSYI